MRRITAMAIIAAIVVIGVDHFRAAEAQSVQSVVVAREFRLVNDGGATVARLSPITGGGAALKLVAQGSEITIIASSEGMAYVHMQTAGSAARLAVLNNGGGVLFGDPNGDGSMTPQLGVSYAPSLGAWVGRSDRVVWIIE